MDKASYKVSIRQATSEDAALISVLAMTTFYEAYFEQDESDNLASYIREAFEIETVRSEMSDPSTTFLILFVNGMAAGYARMIADSHIKCVTGGRTIELRRFYILERYWRSGLGTYLLQHCIDEARRQWFEVLWLAAWEENVRAQSFYSKFGFRPVGTQAFPYGKVVGVNLILEIKL